MKAMLYDTKLAKTLLDHCEIFTIEKDYTYSYEQQRLNSAVLLVQGKINLYKHKKHIDTFTGMKFVGLEEFLCKTQFPYRIEITAGSRVILLNHSVKEDLGLVANSG
tara:strand:+ start:11647 stop:11967 length:321 start_codon:yes stop_codon:yes gene_type:complete